MADRVPFPPVPSLGGDDIEVLAQLGSLHNYLLRNRKLLDFWLNKIIDPAFAYALPSAGTANNILSSTGSLWTATTLDALAALVLNLGHLKNVEESGLGDNHILRYVGGDLKYKNTTLATLAAAALNWGDLLNVNIGTPNEGEFFYYDDTTTKVKVVPNTVMKYDDTSNVLAIALGKLTGPLNGSSQRITNLPEAAAGTADPPRVTQLESTGAASNQGAHLIGFNDSGSKTAQTTVDGALDELYTKVISDSWNRDFLFSQGQLVADSGSGTLVATNNNGISNASDGDGHTVGYNFTATADRRISFSFFVPDDLDTTQAITIEVQGRLSATPGVGQVCRFAFDARAVADNEDCETGGALATIAATDVEMDAAGHTSTDKFVWSAGTLFAGSTLSAGDHVKGVFRRDGAHVNDTFTGTFQVIGVRLSGTKKKAF